MISFRLGKLVPANLSSSVNVARDFRVKGGRSKCKTPYLDKCFVQGWARPSVYIRSLCKINKFIICFRIEKVKICFSLIYYFFNISPRDQDDIIWFWRFFWQWNHIRISSLVWPKVMTLTFLWKLFFPSEEHLLPKW